MLWLAHQANINYFEFVLKNVPDMFGGEQRLLSMIVRLSIKSGNTATKYLSVETMLDCSYARKRLASFRKS